MQESKLWSSLKKIREFIPSQVAGRAACCCEGVARENLTANNCHILKHYHHIIIITMRDSPDTAGRNLLKITAKDSQSFVVDDKWRKNLLAD